MIDTINSIVCLNEKEKTNRLRLLIVILSNSKTQRMVNKSSMCIIQRQLVFCMLYHTKNVHGLFVKVILCHMHIVHMHFGLDSTRQDQLLNIMNALWVLFIR